MTNVETLKTTDATGPELRRQRSTAFLKIAAAFPVAVILWIAVYYLLPPIDGMDNTLARLVFALKCCCIAILFCFLTGIEAVAHERLRSAAIDPLSGYETPRMRVNLRYLQNTLEQLVLFVPGLFALAVYCSDGHAMRAIVATTMVWIVSRAAFWIGYQYGPLHRGLVPGLFALAVYCSDGHAMRAIVATTMVWIVSRAAFWIGYQYGPLHRAIGAPGMMQSMLILLYICAMFGFGTA